MDSLPVLTWMTNSGSWLEMPSCPGRAAAICCRVTYSGKQVLGARLFSRALDQIVRAGVHRMPDRVVYRQLPDDVSWRLGYNRRQVHFLSPAHNNSYRARPDSVIFVNTRCTALLHSMIGLDLPLPFWVYRKPTGNWN